MARGMTLWATNKPGRGPACTLYVARNGTVALRVVGCCWLMLAENSIVSPELDQTLGWGSLS